METAKNVIRITKRIIITKNSRSKTIHLNDKRLKENNVSTGNTLSSASTYAAPERLTRLGELLI